MTLFEQFKAIQKKQKAYALVLNIAGWDSSTEAPKACFPYRAEMLSIISGEQFALTTSEEYQNIIQGLIESLETLEPMQQKEVLKAKKNLDKIIKIPQHEYMAYVKLINLSQRVWEDAKASNDYDSFKPYLDKIIDAQKKMIRLRDTGEKPYNVLLDDYEEGMDMALYDDFFNTIKTDLVPFVKQVLKKKVDRNDAFITESYDKDKQKAFVEYLMNVFNYDFNRGLLKESVHPFTWNTHTKDVRFTVRYLENFVFSSIFAALHELGHAFYEMQIDPIFDMTNLTNGASMGLHESQSRFYENMIGRSHAFWQVHYPKLQKVFKPQFDDISLDDFYLGINKVAESLIRVEADELTYPLHILIRYEIERAIFEDAIDLDQLPELWNEKMTSYLNITPPNHSDGVLQDVHWSAGMFGYFPTYALGSAYAAQIYYTMKKELDFEQLILNNDIESINRWLKDKIHCFGASKKPLEILEMVTKEPFNPKYYIQYLKEKYTKIYEI